MKMIKMVMIIMMAMMMRVVMGDIVDQTCKQTPDYNLCVSLLRSDPRSSSADTAGLALILVDKPKALGTETLEEINNAYKTKPMLKEPLDKCKDEYQIILHSAIDEAIEALNKGDPKFAEEAIVDAGRLASECEDGFVKGQSPLTSLNQKMLKISDVTTAIIRMLL